MNLRLLLIGLLMVKALQAQIVQNLDLAPFYSGVASADPLATKVLIWTRLGEVNSPTSIAWKVATDTLLQNVVRTGTVQATASSNYCVTVDVDQLQANTTYYYQFEALGKKSLIGRTNTLPTNCDSVRLAVLSCAHYGYGYFNTYKELAQRNDFWGVVFLGDYIYESGPDNLHLRTLVPAKRLSDLDDYRLRYEQWKSDPNLILLHQQYPFINVWDDHEFANNAYRDSAEAHEYPIDGLWSVRKQNAMKAYFEWLPTRTNNQSIYRSFDFGNLFKLTLLDGRIEARTALNGFSLDTSKHMIGTTQMNWLKNELNSATHQWKLIGQQVLMMPVKLFGSTYYSDDTWDGYRAERNDLFNFINSNALKNTVVLTGDMHTSFASDLPLTEGSSYTSIGVEFATPAAARYLTPPNIFNSITTLNPHIKWVDPANNGYFIVDINAQRVQADFYKTKNLTLNDPTNEWNKSYYTLNNSQRLTATTQQALAGMCNKTPFAPLTPNPMVALSEKMMPTLSYTPLSKGWYQINGLEGSKVTISVYNIEGKLLLNTTNTLINLQDFESGVLLLKVHSNHTIQTLKLIHN